MLEFKQDYKQHQIDIIVDNARTHTAKAYSLQDFGKSVGTRARHGSGLTSGRVGSGRVGSGH